jgi:serine/threonine protein phosphatase PrpC
MLSEQMIDTSLSGTTVVIVFFDGTRLLCANCGDSRAIKAEIFKSSEKEY